MSAIGGLGGNPFGTQQMSPGMRVGQELQTMAQSGEISSEDQEALSGALYEIGSEMESSRPEPGSVRPTQEAVKEKIEGLIDEQVEAGNLTEEQADQLSELFEEVASSGQGGHGPKGGRAPGGVGGPESSNDMLQEFLQQMQEENASSYGSDAEYEAEGSMLFDYSA